MVAEPIADRLEAGRVGGVGEPVGQLAEPDPRLAGLAFGPLVPVDPDLDRVREVGTDLDERRAELVVPEVEVVAGDPPVGLGERERHHLARCVVALVTDEHSGVLLGHPERSHPGPARLGLRRQVGPHLLNLAVGLGEADHRDVLVVSEPRDRLAERGADLVEDRWRGDRIPQMPGQERDHLPADLQVRHVTVQIDPVQTLQVEPDMPVEKLVDRHRGHDRQRGPLPAC
jgi:hypothetical protein